MLFTPPAFCCDFGIPIATGSVVDSMFRPRSKFGIAFTAEHFLMWQLKISSVAS